MSDPPSPSQLAARRQLDEARERLRRRKLDTRRKIITGALVLAEAGHNAAFARELRGILHASVTREQDRALIADLLAGYRHDA